MCDTRRPDKQEIGELYRKHRAALFDRARRMLGDPQEARDVIHEVFSALLTTRVNADESMETRLHVATRYLCLNRIRGLKTQNRILRDGIQPCAMEVSPPVAEDRVHAKEVLARVPSGIRPLVVSYYLGEMTQEEIARSLGCSRRNVGYQMERVRRELCERQDSVAGA